MYGVIKLLQESHLLESQKQPIKYTQVTALSKVSLMFHSVKSFFKANF